MAQHTLPGQRLQDAQVEGRAADAAAGEGQADETVVFLHVAFAAPEFAHVLALLGMRLLFGKQRAVGGFRTLDDAHRDSPHSAA